MTSAKTQVCRVSCGGFARCWAKKALRNKQRYSDTCTYLQGGRAREEKKNKSRQKENPRRNPSKSLRHASLRLFTSTILATDDPAGDDPLSRGGFVLSNRDISRLHPSKIMKKKKIQNNYSLISIYTYKLGLYTICINLWYVFLCIYSLSHCTRLRIGIE